MQRFFLKKNNAWLQVLENELLSISQRNMTIDEHFNKLKSLCCEISKLNPTTTISGSGMKIIIVHDVRPEFRSFVVAI